MRSDFISILYKECGYSMEYCIVKPVGNDIPETHRSIALSLFETCAGPLIFQIYHYLAFCIL